MKAQTDNQYAKEIKGLNIKGIAFVLGQPFEHFMDCEIYMNEA